MDDARGGGGSIVTIILCICYTAYVSKIYVLNSVVHHSIRVRARICILYTVYCTVVSPNAAPLCP
jgi:hypothetical protein